MYRIIKMYLFVITLFTLGCKDHIPPSTNTVEKAANNKLKDYSLPIAYEGQLCHWARAIHEDEKGHLWIGTNHFGLLHYNGDSLRYIEDSLTLSQGRINCFQADPSGGFWVGAHNGLYYYNGEKFTTYKKDTSNYLNEIFTIHLNSKDEIWVGAIDGVYTFDKKQFKPFNLPKVSVKDTNSILAYDRITSITEDKTGFLWIGTDGFGIHQYDGKTFKHLSTANGLADNNISQIIEDSKGNIWIGSMFGGLTKYDGSRFYNYTQEGLISGDEVYGLLEDKEHQIWFSAENVGVYRYNQDQFTLYNEAQGLSSKGIISIHQDKNQQIWLGGWQGLFRMMNDTIVPVTRDGPWN